MTNLHLILRRLNDSEPVALTKASRSVVKSRYRLSRQLPVWTVFAGFAIALTAVFIVYSIALNNKSVSVLEQLHQLLQ
jgi:type VI secretion system protein ImpK